MKLFLAALALLSATVPAAGDCAPPKLISQITMTPIPTGDGSLVETVPVSLNGTETQFILDTGGIQTQISATLAARLNLPINRTSDALMDVTGQESAGLAMIHDFTLGTDTRHDVPLLVSPNRIVLTGLLALNDLMPYDAELDFRDNLLKLYSPDHCASATALPPSAAVIPFKVLNGHILAPAALEGKPLAAILDTGASASDLPADVAQDMFAITPGAPGTPRSGTLNGASGVATYTHIFGEVTFGPVTLTGLPVNIIPAGITHGPELIIGMDVLKPLDLYFAFSEGKLYVDATPQNR